MKTQLATLLVLSVTVNVFLVMAVSDMKTELAELKNRPSRDTTPRSMDDLKNDVMAFNLLEDNDLNRLV